MMKFIDPAAPTPQEEIELFRKENQKERRAAYPPALTPLRTERLAQSLPDKKMPPAFQFVDWRFLDEDDGPPGEPADWVKKQIERFKRGGEDDLRQEMEDRHRWTRNISPPTIPRRCDPNEPSFDPRPMFGEMDDWEEEDL
jgi:hypothetical protein